MLQFCLSQIVATSLPTSSTTPITIIGMTLAAKIATSPATEYHTATAEILNPLSSANHAVSLSAKVIVFIMISVSLL